MSLPEGGLGGNDGMRKGKKEKDTKEVVKRVKRRVMGWTGGKEEAMKVKE